MLIVPTESAPTISYRTGYLISIPLMIWLIVWSNDWNTTWFLALNPFFAQLPNLLWTGLSLLGNGWAIFALALPLIFYVPRLIYAALISGVLTGFLSNGAKAFFDTPRPASILDHASFQIIDNPLMHSAMPSGHTMTAFSICTAMFFTAPKPLKKYLFILWLLAIGAGCSRIAVGAHWPSDVLVGAAMGIFCGLLACRLVGLVPPNTMQPFSRVSRLIVLMGLLDLYVLVIGPLDFSINRPIQWVLMAVVVCTLGAYLVAFWRHYRRESQASINAL